ADTDAMVTRARVKASPPATQLPKGNVSRRTAGASAAKPSRASSEPEQAARAAVAHEARAVASGADKVKLTLTVLLTRAQAERLTARAIREGKNLDALVAEILGAASGWSSVRRKPAVTWRRVDAHKTQEGAPYGITTDVGMGRVGGRHPAGARLDLRRPDRSW